MSESSKEPPPQKILVTGGAGFIGSRLALALKSNGHDVQIIDILAPQIHGVIDPASVHPLESEYSIPVHRVDVRNRAGVAKLLQQSNAIVHLAAETGTGQSMYQIAHYADVNVQGTAVVLDLLSEIDHDVNKLVVASSRAIYGEGAYICQNHGIVYPTGRKLENLEKRQYEPRCPLCNEATTLTATDEAAKVAPNSVYGITKQVQEQLFLTIGEAKGISTTSLRYQNVYGPGQSLKNPYTGILSIFSTSILNGNALCIFEDGLESRDFVFVDDVVDATCLATLDRSATYEAFNVGYGSPTTVIDVAESLMECYGSDVGYSVSHNFRLGDIRHNYANIDSISSRLGFSPKIDFNTGVGLFAEWVKAQVVEPDRYSESIDALKAKGLYR